MKISALRPFSVRVPVRKIGHFSQARRTHIERTLVEIETEDGIVGLGETRTPGAAAIIAQHFAPALVGQELRDLAALRRRCLPAHFDFGYPEILLHWNAYAAVDIALWDLLGKQTGLPLYALLGGAQRDRAWYVSYEYAVDPQDGADESEVPRLMAENAARSMSEQGTSYVEFKVGVYSVECDIATFRAVRERLGPSVEIGVDANMAWDIETARRFIVGVAAVRLDNLEEPVPDLAGMAALAREHAVPVSTHCFFLDAIRAHPEIRGIVVEPHALGGILPMRRFIDEATALGRRVWFRSVWELGISWAAMCHMGIAFEQLSRPSQSLFNWIGDDLIEGDEWIVRDGGVATSPRPGLGIELDRAAVEKYKLA
jgi:glucarate dehydratase